MMVKQMNFESLNPQLTSSLATAQYRRTIGDWLSPLNFKMTQIDIFRQRTDGTGLWLLESDEFQTWLTSLESETLWCPGNRKICSVD